MPTVAEALRQHAETYVNQFGHAMPTEHKRVLSLITRCRTGELGHIVKQCDTCPKEHWFGRSCGNRHCPNCQHDKSARWLAKRMAGLLPVQYYLVTFTVPAKLRMVVRANQPACYKALFDSGAQTLVELASGDRFIGSDRMGFFGALHTWGRDFTVYNPHVHFVVPGGAVAQDGSQWMSAPENFLLPQKAAAKVYPGKFRDAMREAGLEQQFKQADAAAWFKPWTVDVQSVGNGQAALKYLAPYVNRVAISNNRIEAVDRQSVTYWFTPSGSSQSRKRTVSGNEFVRGFLQHTLPSRFQRIRYYGWASPNSKLKFQYVQMLVYFYLGWCWLMKRAEVVTEIQAPPTPCPDCKVGKLHLTMITDSKGRVIYRRPLPGHAIAYLDSG